MKRPVVVGGILLLIVSLVAGSFLLGGKKAKKQDEPRETTEKRPAPREERRGDDGPREAPREGRVLVGDDPKGALRLEGQVIDADEQPVGGAVVTVNANPPREARTEGDGSYVFEGLLPREYTLVAGADERASEPTTVALTDKTEPVILRLKPGASVEVTVVSARDRKPIAGAEVEARSLATKTATTDADGKALVKGLSSGDLVIKVSARGYAPAWRYTWVSAGGTARKETIELVAGAAVSGTVVDDRGKPVAGARVTVESASELFTPSDPRKDAAITDAKGAWSFPAVPAGTMRFAASHEGFAPGVSEPISLDGTSARTGVVVKLEPGARLAGRVVRGGQPVPFATVRVAGDMRFGWEPTIQRACDERGAFDIGGLSRAAVKVVASDERGASQVARFDLAARPEHTGIELVLDVEGVIAGTVVTSGGEPVEGAQVNAFPDIFSGGGGVAMDELRLRGIANTVTDAGGRFELTGLPDGKYQVRAGRSGASFNRMFARRAVDAKTGDRDVKIILDPDGSVKGRVALAKGGAPELFTVRVGATPGTPFSSPDGEFRLEGVEPGKHTLVVSGLSFVEKRVENVEVVSGRETDVGTITVAAGRSVAGRVVDAGGAPVEGASVIGGRVFGSGASVKMSFGGDNLRETASGADGSFVLGGLDEKPLDLVADHVEKGRSAIVAVPGGAEPVAGIELRIQPAGSLGGKVTKGSKPAGGAIVMATQKESGKSAFMVTAGPDGLYRFERLAAGRYTVHVVEAGMGGAGGQSITVTIAPGENVTRDVDLPVGGVTVKVKVTVEGKAATFAQAFFFGGAGPITARNVAELQTAITERGEGGLFQGMGMGGMDVTVPNVQPGTYTLCALGVTINLMNPTEAEVLEKHEDLIPIACTPGTAVGDTPEQSFAIDVPAMGPVPGAQPPKPQL